MNYANEVTDETEYEYYVSGNSDGKYSSARKNDSRCSTSENGDETQKVRARQFHGRGLCTCRARAPPSKREIMSKTKMTVSGPFSTSE